MFYHYPTGERRGCWKYCLTGAKGDVSEQAAPVAHAKAS
jgi:hypothetical protein